MANWKEVVLKWDAKKTDALEKIYREHSGSESFWTDLIELLENQEAQRGGSWLVKNHYDEKQELPEELKVAWLRSAERFTEWESRLHAYQILHFFQVPKELQEGFYLQIQDSRKSGNKFLKAWSYHAEYCMLSDDSELRRAFREECELAMERESASVKVRLRKIIKALGKDS